MIKKNSILVLAITVSLVFVGCENIKKEKADEKPAYKMAKYAKVELTTDISHLSDNQKEMVKMLFKAAKLMDEIFWIQNVGEKNEFFGID